MVTRIQKAAFEIINEELDIQLMPNELMNKIEIEISMAERLWYSELMVTQKLNSIE